MRSRTWSRATWGRDCSGPRPASKTSATQRIFLVWRALWGNTLLRPQWLTPLRAPLHAPKPIKAILLIPYDLSNSIMLSTGSFNDLWDIPNISPLGAPCVYPKRLRRASSKARSTVLVHAVDPMPTRGSPEYSRQSPGRKHTSHHRRNCRP